jgi:hypothetical protein
MFREQPSESVQSSRDVGLGRALRATEDLRHLRGRQVDHVPEHHCEPLDVGQPREQATQLTLEVALLGPLLHARPGGELLHRLEGGWRRRAPARVPGCVARGVAHDREQPGSRPQCPDPGVVVAAQGPVGAQERLRCEVVGIVRAAAQPQRDRVDQPLVAPDHVGEPGVEVGDQGGDEGAAEDLGLLFIVHVPQNTRPSESVAASSPRRR